MKTLRISDVRAIPIEQLAEIPLSVFADIRNFKKRFDADFGSHAGCGVGLWHEDSPEAVAAANMPAAKNRNEGPRMTAIFKIMPDRFTYIDVAQKAAISLDQARIVVRSMMMNGRVLPDGIATRDSPGTPPTIWRKNSSGDYAKVAGQNFISTVKSSSRIPKEFSIREVTKSTKYQRSQAEGFCKALVASGRLVQTVKGNSKKNPNRYRIVEAEA